MSAKQYSESSNASQKNITGNVCSNSPKIENKKERQKGRWSKSEQLKYFLFLIHHKKSFQEDEARRSLRMYKHMSMFMRTRNPTQCRIRHMKTLKKYGGIQNSIEVYTSLRPHFYEIYEKTKDYLQLIEDRAYCGDFENYQNPAMQSDRVESSASQEQVKIEEGVQEQKDSIPAEARHAGVGGENNIYWHSVITFQPIFYFI